MAKIEIGRKDSAILQAKAVAYRDAYIPDGLSKLIKLEFNTKTGHVHIVGRSSGKAHVTGTLHARSEKKASNPAK
jgi:hypothetical protein